MRIFIFNVSGIPMVLVRDRTLASLNIITNKQYRGPIEKHTGPADGARYADLTRGMNGKTAVHLMNANAARDAYGTDKLKSADSGNIVSDRDASRFFCKLVARPSPKGFDGDNQPVVRVAPVHAEIWCELSGGLLRLPSKELMEFILTRGGTSTYPCGNSLFTEDRRRLVHGQLKLRDGQIQPARPGDPEHNSATCDVNAKHSEGELKGRPIYPRGFKGTRWGGNVCLLAAGDLIGGASWCDGLLPEFFEGSKFRRRDPGYRSINAGFGVVSVRDDSPVNT